MTRERLLAVFTGGTISMTVVPGLGAVPARGGREIVDRVPQLDQVADVTVEDFDITSEDMDSCLDLVAVAVRP